MQILNGILKHNNDQHFYNYVGTKGACETAVKWFVINDHKILHRIFVYKDNTLYR